MKINKKKLGFTLVELLVVIAILAVLATVAIIGYSSFINEANKSNDNSVVTELNHYLKAANPLDEKVPTATDAAEKLEGCGLNIAELQPSAKEAYYGYNYDKKEFVYVEKDNVQESNDNITTFLFVKDDNQKAFADLNHYSVYLQKGYTANGTFDAKYGLDVGEATVSAVNYTSSSGNTVVIRTNGGTLTVGTQEQPAAGKIMHYGTLEEAVVYTTKNSFHTHGKIACMDLKAGKAVAEDKGYVALVKAASDTEIQEVDTGVFYIPTNAVVADIDTTVAASIGYVSNGATTPSYVVNVTTAKGQERAQTISSNAYAISDKNELIAFRDAWNNGRLVEGMTFELTRDIDMSGYEWKSPIGTSSIPFKGTFNGHNYKIINLSNGGATTLEQFTSITSQTTGNIFGLFGYITGNVKISNLTLKNVLANIPNGLAVGALISGPKSGSKCNLIVENITVTGAISAVEKTGGLIGYGANYGTTSGSSCSLTNCYNYASVTTSGDRAAGILSCDGPNGTLNMVNCHNYGSISASTYAAGMVANLNKAQNMSQSYSKSQDQVWRDVITGPSYSYSNCTNEGEITATNENGLIATLFLDKNTEPSAFNTADSSLNTATIKRNILAYYNYVGSNVDWESYDKYGILAGLAYDLNLEGDYAAFVGDCHATTIGKAATYQNSVDKSLVINVKKNFDTVDIHGSVNFENHSGNQINVKTNDTLTLSNGTLAKIKINNADARVTLVNMVITGTALNFTDQADIYLQTADVLSIVSGTYSFNPTLYLAQGSTAVDNGNDTWTVTANN